MSDFYTGRETPNTLYNIVKALERRSDSYLAQAQATDVELYEQTVGDRPGRVQRPPELREVDTATSVLMGMHELLQQIIFYASAAVPKKVGKPKVRKLPRPKTAKQLYEAHKRREELDHLAQVITFVPQEQWQRNIDAAAGGD